MTAARNPAAPADFDPRPRIQQDGQWFVDLDHDGVVAPYEDWRLPAADRARDLLGRMTLAEKVGQMLHGTLASTGPWGFLGHGPEYDLEKCEALILKAGVTAAITRLVAAPGAFAEQNNALQAIAARGRLGIPLVVSTDPRHHFLSIIGASDVAFGFSQWPETLGLGAIGDRELVRAFADIVRQEYRAVGIQMALSPQADLVTSPMWPRIEGSFGEDPGLVRALTGAYVEGLQGGRSGLTADGVATVAKHWVGYGATEDGFDGHNSYGRYSAFPGGAFQHHVNAFLDAFEFKVAGIMPTYNILKGVLVNGQPVEPVGAGFSRLLLTDLLRGTCGFDGVVISDWAISKDANQACLTGDPPQQPKDIAMSWGVEHLSPVERVALGVNAGLDQFGGEDDPALLLSAVEQGLITLERIDQSVLRVLTQTFELGLFDQPFVDEVSADSMVGSPAFRQAGLAAQRQSLVLLKDGQLRDDDIVILHGMGDGALKARGLATTDNPAEATAALIRLSTPYQTLHPTFFFGSRQHEGDLDFKDDNPDLAFLRSLPSGLRKIIVIHLDRPAVLTNIAPLADGLYAEFGASDEAMLDVVTGRATAGGRLPFSLPRSMEDVRKRRWDTPDDDPDPLFANGFSVKV
ncbi:MAG: beta-glucosidase [Alphaproteobacteria bacterium PA2]|nr:MAG: beta-glucosidase [Alphaproteobacteria bacterium PA2]